MNKKAAVWRLIKNSLDNNLPVMLLYVLESRGSSPGRQGFLMGVTGEEMEGSIGGGMMEHKLVEKSRSRLQKSGCQLQPEIIKQVHNKSVDRNQSGMICSGEQTVLLYLVQQSDKSTVCEILSCLANLRNGTLQLSPGGIDFRSETFSGSPSFRQKSGPEWTYTEALGFQNHLYIVGGGHCSLALSNLVSTLDFYIHVFDDRANLLTMEQNSSAHEKQLLNDYSQLASLIPEGESSYVVVMTFGYRTDDVAVRALLNKNLCYFGLLGSRSKIKKMFDDYRKEGIDEACLQRIHAPVGLPINSQTPAEIAVSIAAEIILTFKQSIPES